MSPIIGLGLLGRWFVRGARQHNLRLTTIARRGLDGSAQVVSCTERGGSHNFKPRFSLRVEIEVDGRAYSAIKNIAVHAHLAAKLEPGSTWPVRIHPEDPHDSILLGIDDDQLPT